MFINKHVSLASKALGQQKIALKTHQKDAFSVDDKKRKSSALWRYHCQKWVLVKLLKS